MPEVELLESLGPILEHIEPGIKRAIEEIDKMYPAMGDEQLELMRKEFMKLPILWFVWLATAADYVIARHRLLKGPINGSAEQPH